MNEEQPHRISKSLKRSKKAGLPPGSLVYLGDRKVETTRITLFNYTRETILEKEILNFEECLSFRDEKSVTWINIDGLHDVSVIEKAGALFNLDPLVLEDIVNTGQRPKADNYDDYLFTVLRMLTYDEEKECIISEQVSFVLAKNYVLSFQEDVGDLFDPIRMRIRDTKSKIRLETGNDYLMYRLMDVVVDNYFVLLEKIGEKMEDLEEEIMRRATSASLEKVQDIKKDLLLMRRAIYPLRDVLSTLTKEDVKLVSKKTQRYFRDTYDHTVQVIETIEMFREMISSLRDNYHSQLNIEMNKTIQTLTIFTAIFIPLTFIAGVYGMNFENMPELKWEYGYFEVLGVMGLIFIALLFYFRRKKWL
ncbi:MAG: magnesium/cobalt transporter CorA [Chitinophagales bacterium]|nr:magnesium/cobalt transporter CorA [Chitinophagales bacterium]